MRATASDLLHQWRHSRWFTLVWIIPIAAVVLLALVIFAHFFRLSDIGQSFLRAYPGTSHLPAWAPVGFPAWLAWQHGVNALLIVFVIKSGWIVRTKTRSDMFWQRNNVGLIRTTGVPKKISIDLWLHLTTDTLWLLNGVLFYVLIFVTGQWVRIIPTRWDVVPNAMSAALQYFSLNWPTEQGWVNYNALQMLSYFAIVFIVAPLSLLTGLRMSPSWPTKAAKLNKTFPIELARALHFPLMIAFVAFIVVHVTLVLSTGMLQNLNHMYAINNGLGWYGFWVFLGSIGLIAAGWLGLRPMALRAVASTMGKVTRQ